MIENEEFSSWFKENTPKEGLSENTTFTRQFLIDAWNNGYINGYNKANEWQYPSKGEYPKVKTWVIGLYYGKDNWHKIFYRADGKWWGEGQLCQPPFAWKEIILPKE